MKTNSLFDRYYQRIENCLQQALSGSNELLLPAMRYMTLGGGKRLRPLLVYATGACFQAPLSDLDMPAVAVEFIHIYSLVHDDLPAMDDDDLRRGKPSCHKAFGEATAILVGDALQSMAFSVLTQHNSLPPVTQLQMIQTLSSACGLDGMVGGQALDLEAEGQVVNLKELEQIHLLKTGALLRASVKLGALAAGCQDAKILNVLDDFARDLGLGFQIQDDLLDVVGETAVIGKPVGSDQAKSKATYPALTSVTETKARLKKLYQSALTLLESMPLDTKELEILCHELLNREF